MSNKSANNFLDDPKISVIMSVYNGSDYVSNAIESILNQSFKNFEFIIVDDGSNDNTSCILDKFKNDDERVKIYYHRNQGLTKSLNRCISLSNAKIIARQDADDFSHPKRLEQQYNALKKNKYDFCVSRGFSNEKNKITPGILYFLPKSILLYFINPFIHGTLMIKKCSLAKLNNYDECIKYAQDYDLFCRMIQSGMKFKYLYRSLYTIGYNRNSISNKKKDDQSFYSKKIREDYRRNFFDK